MYVNRVTHPLFANSPMNAASPSSNTAASAYDAHTVGYLSPWQVALLFRFNSEWSPIATFCMNELAQWHASYSSLVPPFSALSAPLEKDMLAKGTSMRHRIGSAAAVSPSSLSPTPSTNGDRTSIAMSPAMINTNGPPLPSRRLTIQTLVAKRGDSSFLSPLIHEEDGQLAAPSSTSSSSRPSTSLRVKATATSSLQRGGKARAGVGASATDPSVAAANSGSVEGGGGAGGDVSNGSGGNSAPSKRGGVMADPSMVRFVPIRYRQLTSLSYFEKVYSCAAGVGGAEAEKGAEEPSNGGGGSGGRPSSHRRRTQQQRKSSAVDEPSSPLAAARGSVSLAKQDTAKQETNGSGGAAAITPIQRLAHPPAYLAGIALLHNQLSSNIDRFITSVNRRVSSDGRPATNNNNKPATAASDGALLDPFHACATPLEIPLRSKMASIVVTEPDLFNDTDGAESAPTRGAKKRDGSNGGGGVSVGGLTREMLERRQCINTAEVRLRILTDVWQLLPRDDRGQLSREGHLRYFFAPIFGTLCFDVLGSAGSSGGGDEHQNHPHHGSGGDVEAPPSAGSSAGRRTASSSRAGGGRVGAGVGVLSAPPTPETLPQVLFDAAATDWYHRTEGGRTLTCSREQFIETMLATLDGWCQTNSAAEVDELIDCFRTLLLWASSSGSQQQRPATGQSEAEAVGSEWGSKAPPRPQFHQSREVSTKKSDERNALIIADGSENNEQPFSTAGAEGSQGGAFSSADLPYSTPIVVNSPERGDPEALSAAITATLGLRNILIPTEENGLLQQPTASPSATSPSPAANTGRAPLPLEGWRQRLQSEVGAKGGGGGAKGMASAPSPSTSGTANLTAAVVPSVTSFATGSLASFVTSLAKGDIPLFETSAVPARRYDVAAATAEAKVVGPAVVSQNETTKATAARGLAGEGQTDRQPIGPTSPSSLSGGVGGGNISVGRMRPATGGGGGRVKSASVVSFGDADVNHNPSRGAHNSSQVSGEEVDWSSPMRKVVAVSSVAGTEPHNPSPLTGFAPPPSLTGAPTKATAAASHSNAKKGISVSPLCPPSPQQLPQEVADLLSSSLTAALPVKKAHLIAAQLTHETCIPPTSPPRATTPPLASPPPPPPLPTSASAASSPPPPPPRVRTEAEALEGIVRDVARFVPILSSTDDDNTTTNGVVTFGGGGAAQAPDSASGFRPASPFSQFAVAQKKGSARRRVNSANNSTVVFRDQLHDSEGQDDAKEEGAGERRRGTNLSLFSTEYLQVEDDDGEDEERGGEGGDGALAAGEEGEDLSACQSMAQIVTDYGDLSFVKVKQIVSKGVNRSRSRSKVNASIAAFSGSPADVSAALSLVSSQTFAKKNQQNGPNNYKKGMVEKKKAMAVGGGGSGGGVRGDTQSRRSPSPPSASTMATSAAAEDTPSEPLSQRHASSSSFKRRRRDSNVNQPSNPFSSSLAFLPPPLLTNILSEWNNAHALAKERARSPTPSSSAVTPAQAQTTIKSKPPSLMTPSLLSSTVGAVTALRGVGEGEEEEVGSSTPSSPSVRGRQGGDGGSAEATFNTDANAADDNDNDVRCMGSEPIPTSVMCRRRQTVPIMRCLQEMQRQRSENRTTHHAVAGNNQLTAAAAEAVNTNTSTATTADPSFMGEKRAPTPDALPPKAPPSPSAVVNDEASPSPPLSTVPLCIRWFAVEEAHLTHPSQKGPARVLASVLRYLGAEEGEGGRGEGGGSEALYRYYLSGGGWGSDLPPPPASMFVPLLALSPDSCVEATFAYWSAGQQQQQQPPLSSVKSKTISGSAPLIWADASYVSSTSTIIPNASLSKLCVDMKTLSATIKAPELNHQPAEERRKNSDAAAMGCNTSGVVVYRMVGVLNPSTLWFEYANQFYTGWRPIGAARDLPKRFLEGHHHNLLQAKGKGLTYADALGPRSSSSDRSSIDEDSPHFLVNRRRSTSAGRGTSSGDNRRRRSCSSSSAGSGGGRGRSASPAEKVGGGGNDFVTLRPKGAFNSTLSPARNFDRRRLVDVKASIDRQAFMSLNKVSRRGSVSVVAALQAQCGEELLKALLPSPPSPLQQKLKVVEAAHSATPSHLPMPSSTLSPASSSLASSVVRRVDEGGPPPSLRIPLLSFSSSFVEGLPSEEKASGRGGAVQRTSSLSPPPSLTATPRPHHHPHTDEQQQQQASPLPPCYHKTITVTSPSPPRCVSPPPLRGLSSGSPTRAEATPPTTTRRNGDGEGVGERDAAAAAFYAAPSATVRKASTSTIDATATPTTPRRYQHDRLINPLSSADRKGQRPSVTGFALPEGTRLLGVPPSRTRHTIQIAVNTLLPSSLTAGLVAAAPSSAAATATAVSAKPLGDSILRPLSRGGGGVGAVSRTTSASFGPRRLPPTQQQGMLVNEQQEVSIRVPQLTLFSRIDTSDGTSHNSAAATTLREASAVTSLISTDEARKFKLKGSEKTYSKRNVERNRAMFITHKLIPELISHAQHEQYHMSALTTLPVRGSVVFIAPIPAHNLAARGDAFTILPTDADKARERAYLAREARRRMRSKQSVASSAATGNNSSSRSARAGGDVILTPRLSSAVGDTPRGARSDTDSFADSLSLPPSARGEGGDWRATSPLGVGGAGGNLGDSRVSRTTSFTFTAQQPTMPTDLSVSQSFFQKSSEQQHADVSATSAAANTTTASAKRLPYSKRHRQRGRPAPLPISLQSRQGYDPRRQLLINRLERSGKPVPEKLRQPAGPEAELVLLTSRPLEQQQQQGVGGEASPSSSSGKLTIAPADMLRQVTATFLHELSPPPDPTADNQDTGKSSPSDQAQQQQHQHPPLFPFVEVLLKVPLEAIAARFELATWGNDNNAAAAEQEEGGWVGGGGGGCSDAPPWLCRSLPQQAIIEPIDIRGIGLRERNTTQKKQVGSNKIASDASQQQGGGDALMRACATTTPSPATAHLMLRASHSTSPALAPLSAPAALPSSVPPPRPLSSTTTLTSLGPLRFIAAEKMRSLTLMTRLPSQALLTSLSTPHGYESPNRIALSRPFSTALPEGGKSEETKGSDGGKVKEDADLSVVNAINVEKEEEKSAVVCEDVPMIQFPPPPERPSSSSHALRSPPPLFVLPSTTTALTLSSDRSDMFSSQQNVFAASVTLASSPPPPIPSSANTTDGTADTRTTTRNMHAGLGIRDASFRARRANARLGRRRVAILSGVVGVGAADEQSPSAFASSPTLFEEERREKAWREQTLRGVKTPPVPRTMLPSIDNPRPQRGPGQGGGAGGGAGGWAFKKERQLFN